MSGNFDPNTSWKFHAFLLAMAFGLMYFFGLLMAVLAIPLIAWVVSRWLVAVPGWALQRTKENHFQEWAGRYYVFDDQQIRIHWDASVIWVVADDVYAVMQQTPDALERRKIAARLGAAHYRTLEGDKQECFSEAGVARYLTGLPEEDTRRFRRWLEREAWPNIRKSREAASDSYKRYEHSRKASPD